MKKRKRRKDGGRKGRAYCTRVDTGTKAPDNIPLLGFGVELKNVKLCNGHQFLLTCFSIHKTHPTPPPPLVFNVCALKKVLRETVFRVHLFFAVAGLPFARWSSMVGPLFCSPYPTHSTSQAQANLFQLGETQASVCLCF